MDEKNVNQDVGFDDEPFDWGASVEAQAEEMLKQQQELEQQQDQDLEKFAAKFPEWALTPPTNPDDVNKIINKHLAKKSKKRA